MWISSFQIIASALTVLVFAYLVWVKPDSYVRSWVWMWVAITVADWGQSANELHASQLARVLASLAMFAAASLLLISLNELRRVKAGPTTWLPLFTFGVAWIIYSQLRVLPAGETEFPVKAAIALIAIGFLWYGHRSWSQRLLGLALLAWTSGVFRRLLLLPADSNESRMVGVGMRALVGLAMAVVIYEEEKRAVEENLLGLSMLSLTSSGSSEAEMRAVFEGVLERLRQVLHVNCAALWALSPFDPPAALCRGFSPGFCGYFSTHGARVLAGLLPRYGGVIVARRLSRSHQLGSLESEPTFQQIRDFLVREKLSGFTCLALQSKRKTVGVLLLSHSRTRGFLPGELRFLLAFSSQAAIALENLRLMRESLRRSEEFEILTHVGTAISSALDGDALLRLIHAELQKLIDVRNFYVAFASDDGSEIRFELEIEDGVVLPKRRRRRTNALTEHVLLSGRSLLIRADVEGYARRNGFVPSERGPKSWMAAPIVVYGKPVGVMALQQFERENAFDEGHLHILEIVAGQAAVSIENARLFSEEQRNARQLTFLNQIARIANSSLHSTEMLGAVAREIQKTFQYDHVGIGTIHFDKREIEFRAEADRADRIGGSGTKHVPLGVGIVGTVARTQRMIEIANLDDSPNAIPVYPETRSVVAIPLVFATQMLGVLNVENHQPRAFSREQVLLLQTLADQLAVALNNAIIFEHMQQQAITDGLTGLKTRRYFMEALQSEWKRATRSGRPFSVVLIDVDNFKQINDTAGHLEGDLVLTRVARVLEQKCRASNVVARYGGDEFTILVPETGPEQAAALCDRLRVWITSDAMLAERRVRSSFGLASFPEHGSSPEEVLRAADVGMYQAKRSGGDRVGSTADYITPDQTRDYLRQLTSTQEAGTTSFNAALPALFALSMAIDAKDALGTEHSLRVSRYAAMIGEQLQLTETEVEELRIAGRLHDVGKSAFSSELLNKNELSAREWEALRNHPMTGAEMVKGLKGGERIAEFVAAHHEWFDGTGYPRGLKGDQIPLGGRILGLAEAYDAMTTATQYRTGLTSDAGLAELQRLAGLQFDPLLVTVFLRALTHEPPPPNPAKTGAVVNSSQ